MADKFAFTMQVFFLGFSGGHARSIFALRAYLPIQPVEIPSAGKSRAGGAPLTR